MLTILFIFCLFVCLFVGLFVCLSQSKLTGCEFWILYGHVCVSVWINTWKRNSDVKATTSSPCMKMPQTVAVATRGSRAPIGCLLLSCSRSLYWVFRCNRLPVCLWPEFDLPSIFIQLGKVNGLCLLLCLHDVKQFLCRHVLELRRYHLLSSSSLLFVHWCICSTPLPSVMKFTYET